MTNPDYNEVHLLLARPNKMFPDWMTERLRFLRYAVAVPCACCGRRRKHHWTMLMNFQAVIFGKHQFTAEPEPQVHPPLAPVCRDHPLAPCLPQVKKQSRTKPKKNP
jgi:hypothetical protein